MSVPLVGVELFFHASSVEGEPFDGLREGKTWSVPAQDSRLAPWQRLERAIECYLLRFEPLRDPAVENHKFPSMIALYWSLVEDRLPPQQAVSAGCVADRLPHLPRTEVIARDEHLLQRTHILSRTLSRFVRGARFPSFVRTPS